MNQSDKTLDMVQEYYGKVLKGAKDLKSNACCTTDSLPGSHRRIIAQIDDEVLDRFYGCGSPIPPALEGCGVMTPVDVADPVPFP